MSITVADHIQGLIFDADGTLIDTMPLHYLAWRETVQAHGGDFPEDLFYDLGGVPSPDIINLLNEKFGYQMDPDAVAHEKETLFAEKYLPRCTLIEPVFAVAQQYKGQLPLAIGTGGYRWVIDRALAAVGLTDFFDTVVTVDDIENGKPAPDTFLEAARRLDVAPANCQVFEDSDAGLESARRAGMTAFDVRPLLAASKGRQ